MRTVGRRRGQPSAVTPDQPGPIDVLQGGSATSRRWLIGGAVAAVLLLAAISIVLAWSQYGDARSRAAGELQARVAAAGAIVDTYFDGQVSTLDSIAKTPAVVDQHPQGMSAFFRRLAPAGNPPFTGGVAWVDRSGMVRASSLAPRANPVSVADRQYFRRALATRSPYVSAGLIGRQNRQPQIIVAVPTFGRRGGVSGILVGSILLKSTGQNRQALDLGYADLQVVDRDGRLLLDGFAPVGNTVLLARIRSRAPGVLTSSPGLDGHGDDVVAFATSKIPGWVTVIDRPRSSVFAPARRALALELGSVAAGVLLVLAILTLVARRARREAESRNERARSWAGLTRTLASTTTPGEVAEGLLASLAPAFPDAVAVVGLGNGRMQVGAASEVPRARRLVEDASALEQIASLGADGPTTVPLEREPSLRDLYLSSGRRLKSVHCVPVVAADGSVAGTISLVSVAPRLEPSEWAVLESFADQAALAVERARRFGHQHELAVQLQRSLLPELLPSTEGAVLVGHYVAGADAVEVGGDWYAAVRRPDGILHLCVGDVSGKGIAAATVMSRKRRTFEIYAEDLTSPAEIVRRMLRHVDGHEMVTLAIVSLDPCTGELAYSCVGHPPPLLLDRGSGEVARLDRAGAPPMGVADPVDIAEAHIRLPDQATVVLYTDGLVERRGENIDDAIDLLGDLIADEPAADPGTIATRVGEAIGAADDDVALLVLSFDARRLLFEVELPADPAVLRPMRRRLHAWLGHQGLERDEAADVVLAVSEACNNAIEHAYRENGAGPVKVSVGAGDGNLCAVVDDQGSWRDETPGNGRGRGLVLMERLMETARVETGSHGTRVTLERRIRSHAATGKEHVPTAT